jgi:hypothetical protein
VQTKLYVSFVYPELISDMKVMKLFAIFYCWRVRYIFQPHSESTRFTCFFRFVNDSRPKGARDVSMRWVLQIHLSYAGYDAVTISVRKREFEFLIVFLK